MSQKQSSIIFFDTNFFFFYFSLSLVLFLKIHLVLFVYPYTILYPLLKDVHLLNEQGLEIYVLYVCWRDPHWGYWLWLGHSRRNESRSLDIHGLSFWRKDSSWYDDLKFSPSKPDCHATHVLRSYMRKNTIQCRTPYFVMILIITETECHDLSKFQSHRMSSRRCSKYHWYVSV